MAFMEAFTESQRASFEASAAPLALRRGEFLIRRGEAGGDLFMLKEGLLEVVDTRATPEVILAVLQPGTVVGELSFLDGSPRSVDVRAGQQATVLRWTNRDLRNLLDREPVLAASFYKTVAELASTRMRRLTDTAMTGGLAPRIATGQAIEDARALSSSVKATLMRIDSGLRERPDDAGLAAALTDELDSFQLRLSRLLAAWPDPQQRDSIAKEIRGELHPYLIRSTLADRSIRRVQGVVASPEILAHALVGREAGEGRFGVLMDRWMLDRPTFAALRTLATDMVEPILMQLPIHRNRRVMILNAATGSFVARLTTMLDVAPTEVIVVDSSRHALTYLDTDVAPVEAGCTIRTRQENLAEFAVGRARNEYDRADCIVIHGLLEYLPDRLAVSLLRQCSKLVRGDGRIVSASLSESADQAFLDRMLRWPTLRRSAEELARLHEAAGLSLLPPVALTAPAQLVVATPAVASDPVKR